MCGQRLCAAKLLHPVFFQHNDPGIVTTRRKFEQECRFLNDMKHPHIVEYLGTSHDPDSGLLVLLMELMDESLTSFLERSQQPLAFHIEVDLCHDIAQALVYIHSKEIIHRDLSGKNVLLLAGRAKITDFGMSKLLDANRRMTPLTMCPGTLAYMPPEALREPPVYSKKMDCFSFGVLQIQIMTRQFPNPGPPKQVVEDSRSPTGTMEMPVLDSERRKSHIDLIDPTHPLLLTALSCLSYLEKDRPSAQDLCQQLTACKEAPCYTESMHPARRKEDQAQQSLLPQHQLETLSPELQSKDQQSRDSQQLVCTLQQELETKDQQLQASQRLVYTLQQELKTKDQLRMELSEQLRSMKEPGAPPQEAVTQQKAIRDMGWQQESKAPEKMRRGSAASDSNMAYFNSYKTTSILSYDSETQVWRRLPDAPYPHFTLVVIHHVLTMVGGQLRSGEATDFLLSLMGEGRDKDFEWLSHYPAMPTKRYWTAVVYSDHSLIVAGGKGDRNRLAIVEVLDTDTRQWSAASPLTHPFTRATITICGERLYMLGGYDQTSLTQSVLTCSIPELIQSCHPQLVPASQSTIWQQITDALHYCSSCATLCGQLVAAGGEAHGNTRAITVYNKKTGSWKAVRDMPTGRRWPLVAIVNEKMMVVGGLVGDWWGTETDAVELLC